RTTSGTRMRCFMLLTGPSFGGSRRTRRSRRRGLVARTITAVSASADEAKANTTRGFDQLADTYDTVIPFFETFGRHLVDAAAPQPGDRVLDVACGRGACLFAAAERVGTRGSVLGVDLSSAMVDQARDELARRDLPAPVQVRVADAERLDLADDSFDVV